MKGVTIALCALGLLAGRAMAQAPTPAATATAQVSIAVNGVASAEGMVVGTLCADPALVGKRECPALRAQAPARPGSIDLVFPAVPPGTYALTVWHDANGDGRTNLPQEGFAFGNNSGPPPRFDAAAIKVGGDTRLSLNLLYMVRPSASGGGDAGFPAPPGAVKTDVRDAGLYGVLYAPAGARNLPVVIAIGGSEGGLDVASAAARSFAEHGYAVLALAYWRAPGLPQYLGNVRLEYFKQAIDWLKTRPEVDPQRMGILGMSRGAEGALLIASTYPDIKAVIAVAPSSHSWSSCCGDAAAARGPAWTLAGQPVAHLVTKAPAAGAPAGNLAPYEAALAAAPRHGGAEIPVERINGPVLLLSGDQDNMWPAGPMAERVAARLKARRFPHAFRHIAYAGAGHLPFFGDPATARSTGYAAVGATMGGTDEGNAAARRDSWPRALGFFDAALKTNSRAATVPARKGRGKPT